MICKGEVAVLIVAKLMAWNVPSFGFELSLGWSGWESGCSSGCPLSTGGLDCPSFGSTMSVELLVSLALLHDVTNKDNEPNVATPAKPILISLFLLIYYVRYCKVILSDTL